MKKQTTYLFCSRMDESKERKEIADNFKMSNKMRDELGNLEKFEFMLLSKDEVVTYDSHGRVKKHKGRVFRGKLIPPLNHHHTPS